MNIQIDVQSTQLAVTAESTSRPTGPIGVGFASVTKPATDLSAAGRYPDRRCRGRPVRPASVANRFLRLLPWCGDR
jgi:hypothetical protein